MNVSRSLWTQSLKDVFGLESGEIVQVENMVMCCAGIGGDGNVLLVPVLWKFIGRPRLWSRKKCICHNLKRELG